MGQLRLAGCPFGDCRTYKHNTNEVERDRPSEGFPIISVSALLKLAEWYETYLSNQTVQKGEQGCEAPEKVESPPATAKGTANPRPDLGKNSQRNSTPNCQAIESDCAATSPANVDRVGGAR